MAGIYIHIPFCRKSCHYCNFHFSTSLALKNGFLRALLKEVEITAGQASSGYDRQRDYLGGEAVETIYFGGGTPSLLSEPELEAALSSIRNYHQVTDMAEITLEANPDDISIEKLRSWKRLGINRLSIGIQSFDDENLRWMNRAHTAQQGLSAIQAARSEGFDNITIDLIYGTPLLTDEQWKTNLDLAVQNQVPHLSCYALTVEAGTALHHMIEKKKVTDTDPTKQAHHFEMLMHFLQQAGYEHYEISNFALPGKRSRHNSSYWEGKKYLGLGPSAHSFNGNSRRWNISNNPLYISSLEKNELPVETETLTPSQQANEYIMTSLRTIEGLNLHFLQDKYGTDVLKDVELAAAKYTGSGKMIREDAFLKLTKDGKFFADGIAADLFV
jgi:oxygen-independent coproporphyrinogen III oxidase